MKVYFGELNNMPNTDGCSSPLIAGYEYKTLLIRASHITPDVNINDIFLQIGDMILFCSPELLDEGGLDVIADLFKEEAYIYPLQHIRRVAADKSIEHYFAVLMRICADEPVDKTDTYLFKLRRRVRNSEDDFEYIEYFRTRREGQYRLVEMNCFSQDKEIYQYGLSCFPDGNGAKWKQSEVSNVNEKKAMNIIMQKELYNELLKPMYDNRPYSRIKNMGCDMEIVEEVIDGYWRERFLINHKENTAYELMDRSLHLTFLSKDDVDWEGVKTLENNNNAYTFSAYYQRFAVEKFKDGVALVEWTLYSDGRYFMDEDGFGMEDNDESVVYGFIDTHANVVVPFQAKTWKELDKQRPEAIRRAIEISIQK